MAPSSASESSRSRHSVGARVAIGLLLLLPYAGLCFPQFYARETPALFGFPFFYWYQFAWVILTSLLLWIVYRVLGSADKLPGKLSNELQGEV